MRELNQYSPKRCFRAECCCAQQDSGWLLALCCYALKPSLDSGQRLGALCLGKPAHSNRLHRTASSLPWLLTLLVRFGCVASDQQSFWPLDRCFIWTKIYVLGSNLLHEQVCSIMCSIICSIYGRSDMDDWTERS